jgi:small subunit ribosomal protein S15
MAIAQKQTVIQGYRVHDKDTGSADVQVALLSERINALTSHLQKFKGDFASRKGLLEMVTRRRKLLDYLARTNKSRYEEIIKKLNLRK